MYDGFAYLVCHSGSLVTCDGTLRQGLKEQRQPAQDVRDITDQCNSRLGTDQRRKDWPPGLRKSGYYVNVSVHVGRGLYHPRAHLILWIRAEDSGQVIQSGWAAEAPHVEM